MTTTITSSTSDTQIAVRACTAARYTDGAPPDICVRLLSVSRRLAALPEGGWPETVQAWQQAHETWPWLTDEYVREIVRVADELTTERGRLLATEHHREVIARGRAIIDAVRAQAAHSLYEADQAIRAAYPDLPAGDREILAAEAIR